MIPTEERSRLPVAFLIGIVIVALLVGAAVLYSRYATPAGSEEEKPLPNGPEELAYASQIHFLEPSFFIQGTCGVIRFPHFKKNSASLLRAGFGNKCGQQHRSDTAASESFGYHNIFQLPFQIGSPRHQECKNFRSLPGSSSGRLSLIFNNPRQSIEIWGTAGVGKHAFI